MADPQSPDIEPRSEETLASQGEALVTAYTEAAGAPWRAPSPGEALDPGATLIRVFARFASHAVLQMNEAPERHRRAFLDLIGIRPLPPRPAKVALAFEASRGISSPVEVPRGTRVFPKGQPEILFETQDDLTLIPARVDAAVVLEPERGMWHDASPTLRGDGGPPFRAFEGTQPVEHSLFIRGDGVFDHPAATQLKITLTSQDAQALHEGGLEWARWDGATWQPLTPSAHIREGLAVRLPSSGPVLVVEPGRAIDGAGRTIEVLADTEVDASLLLADTLPEEGASAILLLMAWGPVGPVFSVISEEKAGDHPPELWLRLARIATQDGGNMEALTPATVESAPASQGDTLTLRIDVPPEFGETEIGGQRGPWIRLRPTGFCGAYAEPPTAEGITVHAVAAAAGLAPSSARSNAALLDLANDFKPFGPRPEVGDRCYFLCDAALGQMADTRITLNLALATGTLPQDIAASSDLLLAFESFDGERWLEIGRSSPTHANVTGAAGFSDDSRALTAWTQEGEDFVARISLRIPAGLKPVTLGQDSGRALRIRILAGGYGSPSRTEQVVVAETAETSSYYNLLPENASGDRIRLRIVPESFGPPILSAATFDYDTASAEGLPPAGCVTLDAFVTADRRGELAAGTPFPILGSSADGAEPPALYLGFDRALPNVGISLYVQSARPDPDLLEKRQAEREIPRLEWSYLSPSGWAELTVEDGTRALRDRGILRFIAPPDLTPGRVADIERRWIRARWTEGDYGVPAILAGIQTNSVLALHAQERQEVLGRGTDQPSQRFETALRPILDGAAVEVEEGDGRWRPWEPVVDFYASGPGSLHCVVEPVSGVVRFGDGRRGRMPPRGAQIRIRYAHGGGSRGNLPPGSLTEMSRPVTFVRAVTHVDPATGGEDAETEAARYARGAQSIRNRGRAVTAVDFEDLTRATSSQVARVKASTPYFDPLELAETRAVPASTGRVEVVIVPHSDADRPTPSVGLLLQIEEALRARALPGIDVVCRSAAWLKVSVTATLTPARAASAARIHADALAAIRAWLHPLTGGPSGTGWPFGRLPHHSDLHAVLMATPGVRHVRALAVRLSGAIVTSSNALSDEDIEAIAAENRAALSTTLVASGDHDLTIASTT